jgi:RHS repeat-associated protein
MYEHGGGINAPLGVVRMEYSSEPHGPQVIVPHPDWRGTYDRGTTIVGSCVVYSSNGTQLAPPPDSTPSNPDQYGGVAGGGTYGGTKEHCIDVDWPGAYTWSARQYRRGYSGPDSWMGSLIFESRDASGLYYRRNRYYDSEKGRFTQEDPIGLAGGVNVYGFANGDALSFRDPSGFSADTVIFSGDENGKAAKETYYQLKSKAVDALRSDDPKTMNGGMDILLLLWYAEQSNITYDIRTRPFDAFELSRGQGFERCVNTAPNTCLVQLPSQPTSSSRLVILAHELSGSVLGHWGIPHNADNGAITGENAARALFNCDPRPHHAPFSDCP